MREFFQRKTWLILASIFILGSIYGLIIVAVNYKYIPLAFAAPYNKDTGAGDNGKGWAWNGVDVDSDGIADGGSGWISFNSIDCDINGNGVFEGAGEGAPAGCPTSGNAIDYGVRVETRNASNLGNFSGFAWSGNVGWIAFEGLYTCDTNKTIVGRDMATCTTNCGGSCSYDQPPGSISCSPSSCERNNSDGHRCVACYDWGTGYMNGWAKIIAFGDWGWIRLGYGSSGVGSGGVCGLAMNGATVVQCDGKDVHTDKVGGVGPSTGYCEGDSSLYWSGWFSQGGDQIAFCYRRWGGSQRQGQRCGVGGTIQCNGNNPSSSCPSGWSRERDGGKWYCVRDSGGGTLAKGTLCGWADSKGNNVECSGRDLTSESCPGGWAKTSFSTGGNNITTCYFNAEPNVGYTGWHIPDNDGDGFPDIWTAKTVDWAWNGAQGVCVDKGTLANPGGSCSYNTNCGVGRVCKATVGLGWINFWPPNDGVYMEVDRPPNGTLFETMQTTNYYDFPYICTNGAELEPTLQWDFQDPDGGDAQTAYQIFFDDQQHATNTLSGISDAGGGSLPLKTNKIAGNTNLFQPHNNSFRNIPKAPGGLWYDNTYWGYIRVWDKGDVASDWIEFAKDSNPLTFTTYKHDFPEPEITTWFPAFPDPPSEGEEARFYATSSAYYTVANPDGPSKLCELNPGVCSYWWTIDSTGPFNLQDRSSSTPIMRFDDLSDSYDITVNITDTDGYSCTSSPPVQFNPGVKLPTWIETKN